MTSQKAFQWLEENYHHSIKCVNPLCTNSGYFLSLDVRSHGSNGSGNPRVLCKTCNTYQTMPRKYLRPES